jgi:hypothetical protein
MALTIQSPKQCVPVSLREIEFWPDPNRIRAQALQDHLFEVAKRTCPQQTRAIPGLVLPIPTLDKILFAKCMANWLGTTRTSILTALAVAAMIQVTHERALRPVPAKGYATLSMARTNALLPTFAAPTTYTSRPLRSLQTFPVAKDMPKGKTSHWCGVSIQACSSTKSQYVSHDRVFWRKGY